MSRCFPFPPPGYEKKARTDDADLLKKEKQREKRHKKEKKDKEKRENKEKREKDRSDGKLGEKKDKKEKHRDKKKEKDRDKDKDKNSTAEEKRFAGQSEGYNGEKLSQKEDRDKAKNSISDQKRFAGQFEGYNGERLSQNSLPAEETKDSKFVQELGRRIRDEERGTGNQLVEKFTGTDRKKDEGMVRSVAKDIGTWSEGKEKTKDKRGDDRKMDWGGIRDDARFCGNAMVQNLAGMVQNKVEGMPRPMEKNIERRMEGKGKTKEKEVDNKRGDKRKDKDREKKSQGKDKDRDKEKKKEEKVKEKSELKNTEQDKLKGSNKNDLIGTHVIKTTHLPQDSDKSAATEGNLRKRKDFEMNGFLHDNDVRPNKLPRPTSSSHPLTENGRKLEPCQTSILFSSDRQGAANSHKVDNKERKVNGIIEAPPSSIPSSKSSAATVEADQIAEVSVKPPHPDLKYLSQVLSVPKMEEWSDFDDQEWLFSSNDPQSKKPKVGSSEVGETPLVWAEALRIESDDVCALPYVIPY